MDENKYITERVEDQIDWYDKKSQSSQKWHKRFNFIVIIASALIPFISGFYPDQSYFQGTLGIIIVISTGLLSLNKFQENWINYRTTAENLKKEKHYFLTRSEKYLDRKDAFNVFVTRIEALISSENSQWSENNLE